MFEAIGRFVDAWWPQALSIIGLGALTALAVLWATAFAWSPFGAIFILLVCTGAAIAGQIVGAVKSGRRVVKIQADLMSSIKVTLLPVMHDAVKAFSADEWSVETRDKLIDRIVLHARAYVSSANVVVDANYYRYVPGAAKEGRLLQRCNQPSNSARLAFSKTRAKTRLATEENFVITQVMNHQTTFCPDVGKAKYQRRFNLDVSTPRNYVSFLTIPIHHAGQVGMISVNADKRGVISLDMVPFLEAVGKLIAIVECESSRRIRS